MRSINWHTVGRAASLLLGIAVITALVIVSWLRQSRARCSEVHVVMADSGKFVTTKTVFGLLARGKKLIGVRIDSLNLEATGHLIRQDPFVAGANVSVDLGGVLTIKVTQKHPLMLVSNALGHKYYVDTRGCKMPYRAYDTTRFYKVGGHIAEDFSRVDTLATRELRQVFYYAEYLEKEPGLKILCRDFFVNGDHEIEILYPRQGFRFLMGDTSDAAPKFERMQILYSAILPKKGYAAYKLINLKYADQVICVRNDTTETKPIPAL